MYHINCLSVMASSRKRKLKKINQQISSELRDIKKTENCFRTERRSDRSLVDSNLWHNKLIRTVSRFRYETMHWILIFSSIEFAKYKFMWAIPLRKSTLTFLNYRFNATWMWILKKKCAKATSTGFVLFCYYTKCTSRFHLHNF